MEERRSSVGNGQERKKEMFFFVFLFFCVSTLGSGLLFALLLLLSTFVETQIDLQRYFC